MKQIVLEVKEGSYKQLLNFLKSLDYVKIVPIKKMGKLAEKKYDFSNLVGKLEWTGDAVAQQRLLRDEW